jgi:hypothetical protein
MIKFFNATRAFGLLCLLSIPVYACDLCAVYNSVQSTQGEAGNFNAGFSHQFTHYESNIKPLGFVNAPGQHVESNVTQLFSNYLLSDRFSLQINLPLIYRRYRRVSFGRIEEGNENGLGDISLLSKWRFLQQFEDDASVIFDTFIGVKLPTGSSDRLREELPAIDRMALIKHGGPGGSRVSGDLLTLGTGSTDGIIGGTLFSQKDRLFINGNITYQYRTTGSYDYRFGNDLQAALSPGYFLILRHDKTLGVGPRISAEWKESNRLNGFLVPESSERQLYSGLFVQYTLQDYAMLNLSTEFPLITEEPAEEVVPRYRIQGSFSLRF